jgi:hypothetical protein
MINDQGGQTRILCQGMEILTREDINVTMKLSGMNLVVNDLDMF